MSNPEDRPDDKIALNPEELAEFEATQKHVDSLSGTMALMDVIVKACDRLWDSDEDALDTICDAVALTIAPDMEEVECLKEAIMSTIYEWCRDHVEGCAQPVKDKKVN